MEIKNSEEQTDKVKPAEESSRLTQQDQFLKERIERVYTSGFPEPPVYLQVNYPMKSRAIAVFLAFIPGAGHLYLGLMQRGLFFMLLVILNIVAIIFFSPVGPGEFVIPLVVLFSLLLPVIVIYNIFDAMQSTYVVNSRNQAPAAYPNHNLSEEAGAPILRLPKSSMLGWVLIIAGALFFFASDKPSWFVSLYHSAGSYIGALILISAGVFLYLRESNNKNK